MTQQNQTASQQAKNAGIKSLRQVAELTGVKERTLINWHKDRPLLFKVVLDGLRVELGLLDD